MTIRSIKLDGDYWADQRYQAAADRTIVLDHIHYPVTDTAGAYCGICGARYVQVQDTGSANYD